MWLGRGFQNEEREREWNKFKKKKKKKKEELCDCVMGFRMRGGKEREEEKKIEDWIKKERFKKEEYKRERETYLWIFELDIERALWLGGSSGVGSVFVCLCLFVCVVVVKSWKIFKEIGLSVW